MSGQYALLNEWIGNKLGQGLHLPTQDPFWISLDSSLRFEHIYIEARELISKSMGINIGFPYQEMISEVGSDEIHTIDSKKATDIFLLDLILLNIDRTASNPNLMRTLQGILSIDYESSLLIQDLLTPKGLWKNTAILQCLKSNPLYTDVDHQSIQDFLYKLDALDFGELVSDIPDSLVNQDRKEQLIKGFERRQKSHWHLTEIIDHLKQIEIESHADKKQRMQKNQEAFIENLKKNSHI